MAIKRSPGCQCCKQGCEPREVRFTPSNSVDRGEIEQWKPFTEYLKGDRFFNAPVNTQDPLGDGFWWEWEAPDTMFSGPGWTDFEQNRYTFVRVIRVDRPWEWIPIGPGWDLLTDVERAEYVSNGWLGNGMGYVLDTMSVQPQWMPTIELIADDQDYTVEFNVSGVSGDYDNLQREFEVTFYSNLSMNPNENRIPENQEYVYLSMASDVSEAWTRGECEDHPDFPPIPVFVELGVNNQAVLSRTVVDLVKIPEDWHPSDYSLHVNKPRLCRTTQPDGAQVMGSISANLDPPAVQDRVVPKSRLWEERDDPKDKENHNCLIVIKDFKEDGTGKITLRGADFYADANVIGATQTPIVEELTIDVVPGDCIKYDWNPSNDATQWIKVRPSEIGSDHVVVGGPNKSTMLEGLPLINANTPDEKPATIHSGKQVGVMVNKDITNGPPSPLITFLGVGGWGFNSHGASGDRTATVQNPDCPPCFGNHCRCEANTLNSLWFTSDTLGKLDHYFNASIDESKFEPLGNYYPAFMFPFQQQWADNDGNPNFLFTEIEDLGQITTPKESVHSSCEFSETKYHLWRAKGAAKSNANNLANTFRYYENVSANVYDVWDSYTWLHSELLIAEIEKITLRVDQLKGRKTLISMVGRVYVNAIERMREHIVNFDEDLWWHEYAGRITWGGNTPPSNDGPLREGEKSKVVVDLIDPDMAFQGDGSSTLLERGSHVPTTWGGTECPNFIFQLRADAPTTTNNGTTVGYAYHAAGGIVNFGTNPPTIIGSSHPWRAIEHTEASIVSSREFACGQFVYEGQYKTEDDPTGDWAFWWGEAFYDMGLGFRPGGPADPPGSPYIGSTFGIG